MGDIGATFFWIRYRRRLLPRLLQDRDEGLDGG